MKVFFLDQTFPLLHSLQMKKNAHKCYKVAQRTEQVKNKLLSNLRIGCIHIERYSNDTKISVCVPLCWSSQCILNVKTYI